MQPSIWWLTLNKWPCSMCCNCQCARRPVLWARTLYKSWVARSWWGHTSCVSDASPGHRRRYNLSTQTTSSPQVWCLSLDSHFTFFLKLTVLFSKLQAFKQTNVFTKKQCFSGQTCMSQGSMLQSKDASRSPSHFLPRGPWNSNIEWNFWQVHWKN